MLISHDKRFVFVHIYKTAGTSVRDIFLPYARLLDRMAYDYKFSKKLYGKIIKMMKWHDDGMKQFTGFHKHAKAFEVKEKLGNRKFDSYYKFTFVRNPFDFLVSLYFYILQSRYHRLHSVVVKMSFLEFLRWHIATNPSRQLDFIVDPSNGKRLIDYIGRFETLAQDITIIQENVGINVKRSIEHKNMSSKRKKKDYRKYYNEESRVMVEEYFKTDLELLGYDFNGFSENMPIFGDIAMQ